MTETHNIQTNATQELVEMHEFFVTWFTGACNNDHDLFAERMSSHFAPHFQIVFPNGNRLAGESLFTGMRSGHGNNPDFKIEIRDIRAHEIPGNDDIVIATYEEWQKNAANSKPVNNGRISTVVFQKDPSQPNQLLWLHVHETWLPDAIVTADSFSF